jgi:queuine tRNA-ribosyltransferase
VPLHALGVGRPDHVVRAAALGYTIFDCSLPTRDARHHRLYAFSPEAEADPLIAGTPFYRTVHILDQRYANDFGPIDATCDAPCCTRYSRAYVRHLFKAEDSTADRLATLHNLRFYARLIERLRRHSPAASASASMASATSPSSAVPAASGSAGPLSNA